MMSLINKRCPIPTLEPPNQNHQGRHSASIMEPFIHASIHLLLLQKMSVRHCDGNGRYLSCNKSLVQSKDTYPIYVFVVTNFSKQYGSDSQRIKLDMRWRGRMGSSKALGKQQWNVNFTLRAMGSVWKA